MKKSQLHMMETIMVVLVFFLLLAAGFIFFISQQKSAMSQKQREYEDMAMIKKTQVVSFLPELQCSTNGVVDSNCYDLIKVNEFQGIVSQNSFYYNTLLGNLKIEISEFDPSPGTNAEVRDWVLFDNVKKKDMGYRQILMPVSLYNATTKDSYFGILSISVYR